MKFRIAIICAAIVVILGGGFLYARTTPHYSIFLLTRALNHQDPDAALKYIDVDSLAESAAKGLFVEKRGPAKAGGELAAAVSENMPSIKEGLRNYLVDTIRSGDVLKAGQKGMFGFTGFGLHELSVLTLWQLDIDTRGNKASVKLKGKPGQSVEMAKTAEGYWKFVGVNLEKKGKD